MRRTSGDDGYSSLRCWEQAPKQLPLFHIPHLNILVFSCRYDPASIRAKGNRIALWKLLLKLTNQLACLCVSDAVLAAFFAFDDKVSESGVASHFV